MHHENMIAAIMNSRARIGLASLLGMAIDLVEESGVVFLLGHPWVKMRPHEAEKLPSINTAGMGFSRKTHRLTFD